MTFFDINTLLEMWFCRDKSDAVLTFFEAEKTPCISFLSVHLFYYFAHKNGDSMAEMAEFISQFTILNAGNEAYELAKKICKDSDFEDALQVATALTNEVPKMVTLDAKLAKNYAKLLEIVLI